jgi:DNA-binding beta-propeller fold protein YncE
MKISDFARNALSICAAIAVATGCGSQTPIGAPGAMPQMQSNRQIIAESRGSQSDSSVTSRRQSNLYVANYLNNDVTVYAPGETSPLQTISQGVGGPHALAFGGRYLYVANDGSYSPYASTVTAYAPDSNKVLRTISQGVYNPDALAFDQHGNLYVGNLGYRTVTIYTKGGKSAGEISQVDPDALAFDSSGDLYVANYSYGTVTVYAPCNRIVLLRTISQGVSGPVALALDSSNNLYVANNGISNGTTVTVYARGSTKVLRTISQGVYAPNALVFDRSGNLYVANSGCASCTPKVPSTVTVYAPGSKKPMRTITKGVSGAVALAIDKAGDLYVSNLGNVSEYAPGSSKVLRTISKGVSEAFALMLGP